MSANMTNRLNLHRQRPCEHPHPRPQHPDPNNRLFPSSQQLHHAAHVTNSASVPSAASFTVSEVAVGLPGTRFETSGGEDPSDSFFYLYFQNGTTLVQMYKQRDNTSGQVSAGGSATLPTMGTITIPTISFYVGVGRLDIECV
jgi:hypothetical protein